MVRRVLGPPVQDLDEVRLDVSLPVILTTLDIGLRDRGERETGERETGERYRWERDRERWVRETGERERDR